MNTREKERKRVGVGGWVAGGGGGGEGGGGHKDPAL